MSTDAPPIKRDLVAVIGTTGVGKSQLAVELALAVPQMASASFARAEIINADSMQVYKGLDVITNKATVDEMKGVKHHLMGFLEPDEEYRVGEFQKDALAKIDELHSNSTLPIAVGGTTYYLQHLIFPNQLVSDVPPTSRPSSPIESPSSSRSIEDLTHFDVSLRDSILSLPANLLEVFYLLPSLPLTSTPTEFPPQFPIDRLPSAFQSPDEFVTACYAILNVVDPDSAKRWHWRDIRKVRRSLEIVWQGRRWGEVTERQREMKNDGARFTLFHRFRTLIFWLYASKEVLDPRLDSRVDRMLEQGLIDEITGLWRLANPEGCESDQTNYSRGVSQAIGYKEFEPYLSAHRPTDQHAEFDPHDPLFVAGLESMKISTRQYAKRQVKWIRLKLIPEVRKLGNQDVTIVLLDATDLSTWNENIRDPAINLLRSFLSHEDLPDPTTLSESAALHLGPAEPSTGRNKITCEACTTNPLKPFLVEERQWVDHSRTRAHRSAAKPRGGMFHKPPKLE